MNKELRQTKPILCRPGGKKLLANTLLKEIPPHKVYVEPFLGTGTLFFKKPLAQKNVLGDNDSGLMRFYKQVQDTKGLTCDLRRKKSKFERLKNKKNKSPCEYAYVTKTSFGCQGTRFNKVGRGGTNGVQDFSEQAKKLREATLKSADFGKLIRENDSKDTFFYLDPPYHETSCSYPENSCKVTPADVAQSVKGLKGKFLLSYNNHPEVRRMFCSKYKCRSVKTRYTGNTLQSSPKQARQELLIKNF